MSRLSMRRHGIGVHFMLVKYDFEKIGSSPHPLARLFTPHLSEPPSCPT